ncbi:hypothetical protein BMS3Abin10_00325 [bacterium BMS3Abin10]|nr:hypothetical protein BMS3Abin10_00325 [bacterium BMS3Abin10]GBE40126.1 hypothetical protein BMS3Bbin08_02764 [bacterium BMS3Bbin08]
MPGEMKEYSRKRKIFTYIVVAIMLISVIVLFLSGYILGPDRRWVQ